MTSEFEIFRWMQVMPRNMEWKYSSLVFLFEYKLSIFKMFSLIFFTKLSGFLSKQSMLRAK